ncbi:type VII secretion system-associated protein [Actinokineospora bangkokensis]|uniref:type VII secretion system-associated protein n=1 Tax=Actinokineospora bangkokensis TaxID=1193682 RepID=UPI001E5821A6|nr:type VII secretion system-associated protein [Actinokineospora bangkokensis]
MKQPEITLDMRVSARSNPNSWLYVIDPEFGPDADVPPWGVVGAYPVDARGEVVERFRFNGDYRPSPAALRLPVTSNPLERLLQLIHTRHRDQRDLLPALLASPLLVYSAGTRAPGGITGFRDQHGRLVVPACTSATHVPPAWPHWREIPGADLARQLRGCPLVLNPQGPLTAVIPAAHLLALLQPPATHTTAPSPTRLRNPMPRGGAHP